MSGKKMVTSLHIFGETFRAIEKGLYPHPSHPSTRKRAYTSNSNEWYTNWRKSEAMGALMS